MFNLSERFWESMLAQFPRLTAGVVFTAIVFPYGKLTYDYFLPNDGYTKAKREIKEQAMRAAARTMAYIDADLKALEENARLRDDNPMKKKAHEVVLEEHTKGKIEILLAPQYNLCLLGESYVVKWPPKGRSNAWLLREEDARAMDEKIVRIAALNGIANPSEQKRTVKKLARDCLVKSADNSMANKMQTVS